MPKGLWHFCIAVKVTVAHDVLKPPIVTRSLLLRQNLPHHFPLHIRQPVVSSGVAVGEPLVVEAEEVQDGGVQVVHGLIFSTSRAMF